MRKLTRTAEAMQHLIEQRTGESMSGKGRENVLATVERPWFDKRWLSA